MDLDSDGRRVEATIKWCYRMIFSDNENIIGDRLGYVDRFLKCTHEKRELVEQVTGIKKIMKRLNLDKEIPR